MKDEVSNLYEKNWVRNSEVRSPSQGCNHLQISRCIRQLKYR